MKPKRKGSSAEIWEISDKLREVFAKLREVWMKHGEVYKIFPLLFDKEGFLFGIIGFVSGNIHDKVFWSPELYNLININNINKSKIIS